MRNFNLRNMWLVAKREYLERVKTKAFLITTLLAPVIIVAFGVGPSAIMMSGTKGDRHIVVVSADEKLAEMAKQRLEARLTSAETKQAPRRNQGPDITGLRFTVDTSSDLSEANRQLLQSRIDRKEIDGFLWLDEASLTSHTIPYTAASTTDFLEIQRIRSAVREAAMTREFEKSGVASDKLDLLLKPYDLDAVQWSQGKGRKAGDIQFWTVFILGFAMYMVTIFYGLNVLRAVITEKSSRIMEVLLSSLTPAELLGGKIFGVAAVGLTQVAIWVGAGLVATAPGAITAASMIRDANFNWTTGIFFGIYFLLGYLLYSSLCAALGAMVNSEQEAQQFQFVIMLPLILSFFYMFKAARAPNDPLVVALSLFPFSTPLVMYARIVLGAAPTWQIALSIALTATTVAGVIWLCARIYRVGVLMYGKKPNLPEIIKWIRYA
jgi:ABC-2 type transport system permease protein